MDFGIDVSHFNRVDDWHAVRGNNITFASVKVTESTGFVDNAAAGHTDRARQAGLHVGGYHFARSTDIGAQVAHFAAHLRARGLTSADSLAPMLDMEAQELRPRANAFVGDFIRRLRAATGVRRVLVYANLDWWRNVLRPVEWADEHVHGWIARFNGDPGRPGFEHPMLALHQHTDQGRVPGIPGHVDRDATIGAHQLSNLLVGNGSAPAPATPPPAVDGVFHVVRPGDTLSAIARQHGTTLAEVVRLNPQIANPNLIFPGQRVRVR